MSDYLKNYKIQIKTKAPVFIGDGGVINNREYIYQPREHRIIVPYVDRLYMAVARNGLEEEFQEYILGEKFPLGSWLLNHGFSGSDFEKWKSYELSTEDYFAAINPRTGKPRPPQDIQKFIKDCYGCPYIPGSSLKGVLRTALLAYVIMENPEKYESYVKGIYEGAGIPANRNRYLKAATDQLEQAVFHVLGRNEKRKQDAVNSVMSGLIVSDSKPLKTANLTLCQKIDFTLDRHEMKLPILRESLKPDVLIEFNISLDTSIFPYSMQTIEAALDAFNALYYERFACKFDMGNPEPGIIWLGGGEGFVAKTIVHAIFNERTAFKTTDQVFQNTIKSKYQEHHHDRDLARGVAPHIYKCTRFDGKLYDMGMAKMESVEVV